MNKLYFAFALSITVFLGCTTDKNADGKGVPKGILKVYSQLIADAEKAAKEHNCAEAARLCTKAKDQLKDFANAARPQIDAANKIATDCKAAPIKKDTIIKVVAPSIQPNSKTSITPPVVVIPGKPEDNASCKAAWQGISKIYAKDKTGGLSAAEKDGLRETIERYKGFGCTEHAADANAILSAIR